MGDIRFHDFKVADNRKVGIEYTRTLVSDNTVGIYNAVVIGRT